MASSKESREFRSRIERVEALIRQVEQFPDPAVPSRARRSFSGPSSSCTAPRSSAFWKRWPIRVSEASH